MYIFNIEESIDFNIVLNLTKIILKEIYLIIS